MRFCFSYLIKYEQLILNKVMKKKKQANKSVNNYNYMP